MTAMTMMRRLFMTAPSSTKGFVLSTKTFVVGHDCVVPNPGMRHGAAGPYSSVCPSTLMANGDGLFRHDAQLLQLPLGFATLARGHAALLPHQFVGRDGSFAVAGERFSARLVELRVEVRVASSQLFANQSLDGAHAQLLSTSAADYMPSIQSRRCKAERSVWCFSGACRSPVSNSSFNRSPPASLARSDSSLPETRGCSSFSSSDKF